MNNDVFKNEIYNYEELNSLIKRSIYNNDIISTSTKNFVFSLVASSRHLVQASRGKPF